MDNHAPQLKVVPVVETTPFAVWLGRALKSCHEEALHEPIPAELLDLLPPAPKQR